MLAGFGGVVDALGPAPGLAGRHEPPVGAAGLGATDDAPDVAGVVAVEKGFGATDAVAGAGTDVAGFGATEVDGAGAIDEAGFGATDVLALEVSGPGARDAVVVRGLAASGGAGIDVSPVAGPGPSGAGAWTGIVVEGPGGASSRHARPSASKLRSVLRPQMGQSHPTSNRFSCASMVCAGARSRTRSRPIAKPAST